MVYECGAFTPALLGTFCNLPAGSIVEKFLYSFYADLLIMDQVPEAPDPFDIIFRIVPVFIPSGGFNKTVLLIKPQGLVSGSDQFRYNSDRIQWHTLFFFVR